MTISHARNSTKVKIAVGTWRRRSVDGQVLTELVHNTGGDAHKMLLAVERAKTDPAGFAAMLSPATQQRLRDLSVKLSDMKR